MPSRSLSLPVPQYNIPGIVCGMSNDSCAEREEGETRRTLSGAEVSGAGSAGTTRGHDSALQLLCQQPSASSTPSLLLSHHRFLPDTLMKPVGWGEEGLSLRGEMHPAPSPPDSPAQCLIPSNGAMGGGHLQKKKKKSNVCAKSARKLITLAFTFLSRCPQIY